MNDRLRRHDIQAYAQIANTIYEIASASLSYSINDIPTARIALGIGRDVVGGTTAPATDRFFDSIGVRDPAQIIFNIDGISATVFDGYVANPGFGHSSGKIAKELVLDHWLTVLADSHPLVEQAAVSTPNAFFSTGNLGSGVLRKTTLDLLRSWVGDVSKGLWNEGVLPVFQKIVQSFELKFDPNEPVVASGNASAEAALNRFQGSGIDLQGIQLKIDVLSNPVLSRYVSLQIARSILGAFGGYTLWECLMRGIAQGFSCMVIPTVNGAALVPTNQAADTAYLEIGADEYESCLLSGKSMRRLKALGVYSRTDAGQVLAPSRQKDLMPSVLYKYVNPNVDNGVFVYERGPLWLTRHYAAQTTPATVSKPAVVGRKNAPTGSVPQAPSTIGDLYAKARYGELVFSGRTGTLYGRLRFDISPGTIVRIESVGERVGNNQQVVETLYARVYKVTIKINAGPPPLASTTLYLDSIRSEAEQKTLAVGVHPLYNEQWTGSYLEETLKDID